MKAWLQGLAARVDALSLRERVLLFLAVVAVLYVLWDQVLMAPLERERRAAQAAIEQATARIAALDAEAAAIVRRHREDPNAPLRARERELRAAIAEADGRLAELTVGLIAPREMARVLEAVLARDAGLRLVRLENRGRRPLLAPAVPGAKGPAEQRRENDATGERAAKAAAETGGEGTLPRIWRHDVRLELEGGFLAALRYLKALERLERRFFWDGVVVQVERYPKARVRIDVHTLSLEEGWIGA